MVLAMEEAYIHISVFSLNGEALHKGEFTL